MPRTTVADFAVDFVRVLDEDGRADADLDPDLDPETLREMYRTMRRSRRLDERAIALQRRGELSTYPPAIGQEGAQVGSAFALDDTDWVVPSFREQGVALARGAPMSAVLLYAAGFEEGAATPGSRTLPPAIPTGSQTVHATGVGWAQAIRDEQAATLAYFGDGSTSEGDVYEAVNLAGVLDAHTVFLCQNNQYAISVPRSRQSRAETLAQKAVAGGIRGVQVDGNDVLGTYLVTREALERAREGAPTLVEALTYRRSMHTTADDPTRYRTREEEAEWEARDPIARFEAYLRERDLLDDEATAEVGGDVEEEIDEAVAAMTAAREGADPRDVFRYVYAELPDELERQLAAWEGDHV